MVKVMYGAKEYEYLGISKGAGDKRGELVHVYRDLKDGAIYHRTDENFKERMKFQGRFTHENDFQLHIVPKKVDVSRFGGQVGHWDPRVSTLTALIRRANGDT